MNFQVIVFWALSFITVVSALGVVFFSNIVHSALALIAAFLGVAGIYITLHADFLAAVQVLVYAGAVSILIVFGIMLTARANGKMEETNLFGKYKYYAFIISSAFAGVLIFFLVKTEWVVVEEGVEFESLNKITEQLFTNYALTFELAAVLLTTALIGAIVIAKEVKDSK